MTQATEKSAMGKIYMRLLPFAILSYFLAYVGSRPTTMLGSCRDF
jgi:hypothetical protein